MAYRTDEIWIVSILDASITVESQPPWSYVIPILFNNTTVRSTISSNLSRYAILTGSGNSHRHQQAPQQHREIINLGDKYGIMDLSILPIVDINVELKASSENLNNTHVFPTPESPINKSLNK